MNRSALCFVLVIWLGLLAGVTGQVKQEQTMFQKCDRNKDGHLDDEEFYVYSLHTGKAAAYWEAVDPKYEGKIDSAARDKMEKVSQDAARTQLERDRLAGRDATQRDPTRVQELSPSGTPAPNLRMQLFGFEIARTYEQITLDPDSLNDPATANKAFETAQPAIFSYKHDLISDEETWQASGVIAYPIKLGPEFWIAPSFAIERIGTKFDQKARKDSLTFRLQSERTVSEFPFPGDSVTFRGNVLFNTDSQFIQQVLGAQLDIQPTTTLPGNERWDNNHIPGIKWRWSAFLHAEGGAHLEDQSGTDNGSFFRLGPKVNFTAFVLLNPKDFHAEINNRLQLAVDYNYFAAFGTARDGWLLRAQAINWLDHDHHLSLNAEYSNGFAPLTNTKSEMFLISFGVKF
jgi:hypothetical protein